MILELCRLRHESQSDGICYEIAPCLNGSTRRQILHAAVYFWTKTSVCQTTFGKTNLICDSWPLVSFSFRVTPNFALVRRQTAKPILRCFILRMILAFRGDKTAKMFNFTPKIPQKEMNMAFSSQTRITFKLAYLQNSNHITHNDKYQLLRGWSQAGIRLIQDGGRPSFKKSKIAICPQLLKLPQRNLAQWYVVPFWIPLAHKNLNVLKFNLAD